MYSSPSICSLETSGSVVMDGSVGGRGGKKPVIVNGIVFAHRFPRYDVTPISHVVTR